MYRKQRGFTLIELIAVLLIVGILGATAATSLPSKTFQLQSSRDRVVTAFFAAQQHAMVQRNPVRLAINSPNQVDIREDTDGDGGFADETSIRVGGTSYPITLLSNQSLTAGTFDFDRLGKTDAASLTLSQGGSNINISVSATGFIQ